MGKNIVHNCAIYEKNYKIGSFFDYLIRKKIFLMIRFNHCLLILAPENYIMYG